MSQNTEENWANGAPAAAPANNLVAPDPLAALSAELDGCRKAIEYCLKLAMAPEPVPADYPRPKGLDYHLVDRTNLMTKAVELMEASAALGEAIARIKGDMRQSITVDKYEHGPAGVGAAENLSRQRLRERRHPAVVIHAQGEGGVPESEKQPGE